MMDLTFLEEEGYIAVFASGKADVSSFLTSINTIVEKCKDLSYNKLLIDLLGINDFDLTRLGVMGRFLIGEKSGKMFGPEMKVAAVLNEKVYDGTTEIIAKERGANIKYFFSKEAALKWLSL